jgi:hypothetical protein
MIKSFLLAAVLSFSAFSHDLEIKINGLVCSSCGIGIKRGFKRDPNVVDIRFDTKKQLALVDLKESDSGRVYWISNQKITRAMKSLVLKGLVMQSREDTINHERVNW